MALLDVLLARGSAPSKLGGDGLSPREARDMVGAVESFQIDEVAAMVRADDAHKEWVFSRDFPCVAPPYDRMWFEANNPPESNWPGRMGVLAVSDQRPNYDVGPAARGLFGADVSNVRWLMTASLFTAATASDKLVAGPAFQWIMALDSTGALASRPLVFYLSDTPPPRPICPDAINLLLVPVLMALSLLNCRNVVVSECTPPSKFHQSVWRQKHGRPLVTMKTLDVIPMRREADATPEPPDAPAPLALHSCRGHFKDYRRSAGLFGKLRGLFWWGPHLRGSASSGLVIKDYRVHPAAEPTD